MSVEFRVRVDLPRIDVTTRKALTKAARKAGSTALRDMRAELTKRVRQRKRIKVRALKGALRLRRARGSRIEDFQWAVDISNQHARVADYPHRQTKAGISVEINRGKRSLISGAFKATMSSGHNGVFERVERSTLAASVVSFGEIPGGGGGPRVGRLPIRERLASRVLDAVRHPGEIPAIQRRGEESFSAAIGRLFPLELEKEKVRS